MNAKLYKRLTPAEVGETKTHEVYVRIPNDFDQDSFFNGIVAENGSVLEAVFKVQVRSPKNGIAPSEYEMRFVYYVNNANKEKRIPGLSPLFKMYDVKADDIICLEKVEEEAETKYILTIYGKDQISISPNSVFIAADAIVDNPEANPHKKSDEPLQLIYYGAPGTGKSFTIDKLAKEENSVRTTFHPDTDYASFVGAYKPTMENVRINSTYGESVQYATGKNGHPGTEKKIVYKYVPQAFLKAYVAAWKNLDTPFYLVIEEINRGNCAQIFGDLFQLLDRNNMGCSSYPIHADEDIRQFLATDENGFGKLTEEQRTAIYDFSLRKDNDTVVAIGPEILSGEKLLLPPNLRIWATMNTSDQSLFPIDSAFKRRWNWKYMPIAYDRESWRFQVEGNLYLWGDFLRKINPIIARLTESSDKQMGYYFAKADPKTGVISEEVFLNKVLFYLWTDVLKDYSVGEKEFIDQETKKPYAFTDFFNEDGTPSAAVGKFIAEGLQLEPVSEEVLDNETDADEPAPADGKNPYYPPFKELIVKFPDGEELKGAIRSTYVKVIEKIGVDRVEAIATDMKYKRRNSPLVAKTESQAVLDDKAYRYEKVGDCYVMLGMKNYTIRAFLNHVSEVLGLGLEVEFK